MRHIHAIGAISNAPLVSRIQCLANTFAATSINIRFPTHGELFVWDFEKDGREVKVRVEGQLTFNSIIMRLDAALAGLGLAYLPEDRVASFIEDGRLVAVLDDWCQPCAGYHLYYPNRRHASLAFSLVVDALRYKP